MKFDIPVPCFFGGDDFCAALKKIGELGFAAAETYDWKRLDPEKVRAAQEESGVKLISMCTSFFNMTAPECRGQWVDGLRESCEAAKKMGVSMLITQVGNDTGEERALQHESIVRGIRAGAPILEEYGITLLVEPLNILVDHKGYYLPSSAEAFDIIREAGCKNAKVVFDIYHQQISEGNIIPNILANLDMIAHLHCAGHPGRHDLQFGENDYKVIFEAVDKAGYTGFCGLEYSPRGDAAESLETFKKLYM